MSITLQLYNTDSLYSGISNGVDVNSIAYKQSQVNISSYSATEMGGNYTGSNGVPVTIILNGSFDISAFTTTPKTLADLLSSNASLLINSYTQYAAGGALKETFLSSSPVSLSSMVYSGTSLTNIQNFYSGNDVFYSSTNNTTSTNPDVVYGYAGNDTYNANHLLMTYDDLFYGESGTDTAVLPGKYASYTINAGAVWDEINQKNNLIGFTIEDNTKTYNTLQINQVERVQFSDGILAHDFSQGNSGYNSAMMIGAAFGKGYINLYFPAGVSLYDQGQTNLEVATLIENLGLIENQIGSTGNAAWVNFVYKNVIGVEPDTTTEALFVNDLISGVYTKASLLAAAAGVTNLEQQIDLIGLQQTGLFYHP